MSTRTERLVAKFDADTNGLVNASKQGVNALKQLDQQATRSTKVVLSGFSGINLGFAALTQNLATLKRVGSVFTDVIKGVDAMAKTARAAGLTAEAYQEMAFWADMAGVEQTSLDDALVKLNVNLGKAAAGSKKQADAFNTLGVTTTDADAAMRQIAEGFAGIQNQQERARLGVVLFGEEAGPRMAEALAPGIAALEETRKAANKLSDEQVRAAEELADRIDQLSNRVIPVLQSAALDAADALRMMLAAGGTIDATGISEMQARVEQLRDDAKRAREALDGGFAKGSSEYRAKLQVFADKKQAALSTAEANLEAEMRRRGMLRGPQVAPDGTPVGQSKPTPPPKPTDYFKGEPDAKKEAADAKKAEAKAYKEFETEIRAAQKAAELAAQERVKRVEEQAKAFESAELARDAESEAIERQKEKIRDFTTSMGASFADLAIQGTSAADDLKRKIVMALIQASAQSFGGASGGSSKGGLAGFALNALGAVAGVSGSLFDAKGPFGQTLLSGNAATNYGDLLSMGGGAKFASGGSFRVGGSGGTDSKRISFDATPGELVEVRRPGGTSGMGGQSSVNVEVPVTIVNQAPGVEVTQERGRGANGQDQIQILVRRAMQEEVARRGPAAGALAADIGAKRAPRSGIS